MSVTRLLLATTAITIMVPTLASAQTPAATASPASAASTQVAAPASAASAVTPAVDPKF